MPVVPFSPNSKPTLPKANETDLLMALATMHEMGRLNPNAPTKTAQNEQSLEQSVYGLGEVRINPSTIENKKDKDFLKNLPSDVERIDLNEFGEGHEHNTIRLRLKKAPLTS